MPSVPLSGPLLETRFVARPNRFVLHCRRPEGGPLLVAHLADPGRLRELLLPGARVWLRPARDPRRATRFSAVLVERPDGRGYVSVDTTLPNRLVARALAAGRLDELAGWELVRAEAPVGGSRFDFLLAARRRRLLLEVKSVTLVEDGVALFPDAVTARGARHVLELAEAARRPGWRAAILFVAQRADVRLVRAAEHIDPAFAGALRAARAAGVSVWARRCRVSRERVTLAGPIPVE